MNEASQHPNQKITRLNIRATAHQKEVIERAAKLKQTTLSDFVLENAYEAALQALAEETHIEMTEEQFEQFCKALDSPPPANLAALKKLLTEPSVLDG